MQVQDLGFRAATPTACRRFAGQHRDGVTEGRIIVRRFSPTGITFQHEIIVWIQFQTGGLRRGPAVRSGFVLGHLLDIWKIRVHSEMKDCKKCVQVKAGCRKIFKEKFVWLLFGYTLLKTNLIEYYQLFIFICTTRLLSNWLIKYSTF